jgi:hypothetical protein
MTLTGGDAPANREASSPGGAAAFGRRALYFFAERWSDLVYALLACLLTAWVAWDAAYLRYITYNPGSDYWEHSAVLRALIEDPWHPLHPMTGSAVGSPRFSPHFLLIALVSRALDFDPIEAMGLASVLNTILFLLGIFLFFRTYFRSRLASLLGLLLMFGGWLVGPHFSNVYKLSVYFSVAGYPSTAALGTTLLTFTLALVVLRSERERRWLMALLTLAWAYIYITHPLTAMMALTGGGILALTEPGVSWRRRLLTGGTIAVGLLLTLIWPYYPAVRMVAQGTVERVSKDLEKGEVELHAFYQWRTLAAMIGLAWPGVLLIPYFIARRRQLFLALTPLVLLAVFAVNAFVALPLGHRFILLAIFFFQTSTVWLLLALVTPRPGAPAILTRRPVLWLARGLVGLVFLWSTLTNARAAEHRLDRRVENRVSPTVRFAKRVAELAGPGAVVLADKLVSWSLPTYGTRVIAFHHRNPLVPDAGARNAAVSRFFSTDSDADREATLAKYGVTHVVVSGRTGRADQFLAPRAKRMSLPNGARLYALRRP